MIDTFPSRSFTVSFDDDGSTILVPNRPPLEEEEQQTPEEEQQAADGSELNVADIAVSLILWYLCAYHMIFYITK